jgi:uncharacterized protein YbjT (DUF2867 family)
MQAMNVAPSSKPASSALRLMLLGATGVVGSQVLDQALSHTGISVVVAPTRRPLPAHPKLDNPLVDFASLPLAAPWWPVDAVICALGTTLHLAGSAEKFVQVDRDWPVLVARLAQAAGATRFALNSSIGADSRARGLYIKTKGQAEEAIKALAYPSYTIVRPSLINAHRQERRPAETVGLLLAHLLKPLIPPKYRAVTPERIAAALLQGVLVGQPGVKVVESDQLQG